jgi:hypothetical protein
VITRANTAGYAYVGTWFGKLDSDGFVSTSSYDETNEAKYFAGGVYTLSVYVRRPGGTGNIKITGSMTLAGSPVGASSVSTQSVGSAAWVRLNVTITTTEECDGLTLNILDPSDTTGTTAVDALMIQAGTTLNTYFDGNTASGGGGAYFTNHSWEGTANASASLEQAYQEVTDTPVTVAIADTGSDINYQALQIIYGSEMLTNRAVISRVGGGTAIQQDQTSIDAYGLFTFTESDNLSTSDATTQVTANLHVASYKEPEYRFESVTISLDSLTLGQQNSLLALDIHDALNITYTPSKVGSALVLLHSIIGVSQTLGIDRHDITFNLQMAQNQVFTLDSNLFGILDSNILTY